MVLIKSIFSTITPLNQISGLVEAIATPIVCLQRDAKVTTLFPRFRFRATYLVVRSLNLETKKTAYLHALATPHYLFEMVRKGSISKCRLYCNAIKFSLEDFL